MVVTGVVVVRVTVQWWSEQSGVTVATSKWSLVKQILGLMGNKWSRAWRSSVEQRQVVG